MNGNFPHLNPSNYKYPNSPEHGGPRPMFTPVQEAIPVSGKCSYGHNSSYTHPCIPAPAQNQGPSHGVDNMPNENYNFSGYPWGHHGTYQPRHYHDTAMAQVNTGMLSAPNIMDDPIPPTVSPCQAVSSSGNTSGAVGRESHLQSPKGTSTDIEMESLTSAFDSTLNISKLPPGQTDQRPQQTHQPRERLINMFRNKHAGNPEDNGKGQLTEKGREHGQGNNRSCEGGQKIFSETKINRETASARNECNDPTDDISYYSDKFLLTGLNDKVGQETLSDYVEVTSTCEVQKIEYSKNRSAAVITLTSAPDWQDMEKRMAKRKLEGNTITCKRLPVSRNICVWNSIANTNLKTLENYFETVESGNRHKVSVSLSVEDGCNIVTFENHSAVELVLSKSTHVVSNIQLDVSAYYDGLGPVERMPRPVVEKELRSLCVGEIRLLQIIGFLNNLTKELEHLNEASVLDEHAVLLKGEEMDVEEAIQKLEMFKADVKTKWVSCSKAKMKYLESEDGGETILSKLLVSQVQSAWTCESSGLYIYALSDRELEKTIEMVESHLKEDHIFVGETYSHSQKDLLSHLKRQFNIKQFCLHLEHHNLYVVALREIFSNLFEKLRSLIQLQSATKKAAMKPKTEVVTLTSDEFEYLKRFKQEDIRKFTQDLSNKYQLELSVVNGKYTVTGENEKDINYVCTTLKNFVRKGQMHLDMKESEKLLQIGSLSVLINHIANTQRCIIVKHCNEVYAPPQISIEEENLGAVGGSPWSESKSSQVSCHDSDLSKGKGHTDHTGYETKGQGNSDNGWMKVKGKKTSLRANRTFVHIESSSAMSSHHVKISVIRGEIAKAKAQVIVNTVNTSLDLSRGAVSKSILDAGGFLIQSECRDHITRSGHLQPGSFAVTNGGKLNCKKLYHCTLPAFTPKSIEVMSRMVQNILVKATKHNTKDIAFPALGTGNLRYPPEEVARAMFQTVQKFGAENPHSSIKEVHIVIYKDDQKVHKAFKDEEQKFYKALSRPPRNAEHTMRNKSPPSHYGNARHSGSNNTIADHGPLLKVRIGSFTVRIKQGDISQEENVCIVSPINRDMNLNGGSVSKALYKRGGKTFMDKTNAEKNELSQNRVAVVKLHDGTGVLHLHREMISKNQPVAMSMCIKHARTEGYRSVAFPILQTGDAEKQMAKDLFETLKKLTWLSDYHSRTATDVYVVIHKKPQADQFCQTFSELCKDGETAEQCQEQITLTFLSDKEENLREAKQRLKNYCGSADVIEKIQIPTGITEDEVGSLGRRYDHTNITWLDNRWLQLKGNPANVSKTLEAFIKFLRGRSPVDMESDDNVNESSLFGDGESASRGIKHPAKITKEKISFTNEHFEKTGRNAYGSLPSETNEETEDRPLSLPTPMKHSWHGNSSEKLSEEGPDKEYSTWPCSDRESTMEADESRNMVSDEGAKQMTQGPNRMKWLFLDPDTDEFEQYEDSISRDIETSYVNMKDKHELPEDADTGKQFIVDFKIMEEYPEGDPSDKVAVWRKEEISTKRATADTVMPSSWDPMDDGSIRVVQVKHSNESFEEVREEILKSCGNLDVSVVKVERVQNRDMFERYHAKKMMMDDESGETSEEKILWYGCEKTDSIVPINRYGVSLNHCRQEYGGPLGEGILFYKDFQNVVKRHVDGSQYAYFCRVLVGKYTKGEAGLRDPPPQPASEGSYYHSVVDNIDNPTTYAVFSDAQVYPNYLVTYRLIREEGAVKP